MVDVRHGFHVFKDGSAWCAVGPHFLDLMSDPAGFGDTPAEAIAELHKRFATDRWWDNKALPQLKDFNVHAYQNCERYKSCEAGSFTCWCEDDPAIGDLSAS